jgi:hypothetical protein
VPFQRIERVIVQVEHLNSQARALEHAAPE